MRKLAAQIIIFAVAFPLGDLATAENAETDFADDILPVLAENCFACHGPDEGQRKADLRLDVESEAKKSVIVPGDVDASAILERIASTDPDTVMPPPDSHKQPLTAEQIETIRTWIAEGAEWGRHWSHVPPAEIEPPAAEPAAWVRNPIDQFVLARLNHAGLEPSAEASLETLVRRLSLDLTGLPPTLEMIDDYAANPSEAAYEELVDALLASPAFGENMARDWLDGARYADTNGYQNDFKRAMWPWRDWVIDAFNANMPFDQFTVEQLAGDLLPNATESQRVATGFNRNNRSNTEGGSIEAEWRVENIVDRMETTGEVFMGLSIGCARCHDHKYDPVSREEFYEFFAFFNSTADKGFYEETRGNTGPQVQLPTFENQVRISEYDREIALMNESIAKAEATLPFEYMAWRARLDSAPLAAAAPEPAFRAPLDNAEGADAVSETTGPVGTALAFNGTPESVVDLGEPVAFNREQPFSVSLWVKPEAPGALFSKTDDASNFRGVDTLLLEKGVVAIHLINTWPDDAIKVLSREQQLRNGVWSHVCVTYDGSSKAKGITLYINGVSVPLETEKGTLSETISTEQPLRIGSRSASAHFKGALTDFRYFDQALTPEAANALSESGIREAMDAQPGAKSNQMAEDYFDVAASVPLQTKRLELADVQQKRSEYIRLLVPTSMVMQELDEPRPTYLLIRGQYDAPDTSRELHPDVPAFLPPLPEDAPPNRLGLAQWLVDPGHPLTSRVIVNRYWQMMFGRGIVETAEDFGIQGKRPTHPELLDWLARDFIASGWDLKHLLKQFVMSATYRQSSALTDRVREVDPKNRLFARAPRFRFPAEVVRDNALAVSGLLTRKIGGPSVKPYQPEGVWAELAGGAGEGPYVMAKGEDLYRRSLYTYRKRTVPHPTLATFDAPGWDFCEVRRGRTNTPLQALALLNDTTYAEAARHLAARMIREGGDGAGPRITHGFRLATGREPTEAEREVLERGLDGYLTKYGNDAEAAEALAGVGESPTPDDIPAQQLAAYTSLASVVLNLDETITRE